LDHQHGAANACYQYSTRLRSENPNDLETLQILAIFCGIGLVTSLLFITNGWT
jgi:hypothetical protein